MKANALEELRNIVKIEGVDRNSGNLARAKALEEWISENVIDVKFSQSVIKNNLTSEESDYLMYYLAYQIGDKLMDDCIEVYHEKNKITTTVKALKR